MGVTGTANKSRSLRRGTQNPMSYKDEMHEEFVDVSLGLLSPKIVLLNKSSSSSSSSSGASPPKASKPIIGTDADDVVDKVLSLFTDALAAGDGAGDNARAVAKSSNEYSQAVTLSQQFRNFDFEELRAREERYVIFIKLSNTLRMHASIAYDIELKAVLPDGKIPAYNVGGKCVNENQMVSLC